LEKSRPSIQRISAFPKKIKIRLEVKELENMEFEI
jgi:hypothetical protein